MHSFQNQEELRRHKARSTIVSVFVPTYEHVTEIVGKQGKQFIPFLLRHM